MSRYYDWFESVTPEEYPEPRPTESPHEFDYPETDPSWEVEKAKARAEYVDKWLPLIRMRVRQAQ